MMIDCVLLDSQPQSFVLLLKHRWGIKASLGGKKKVVKSHRKWTNREINIQRVSLFLENMGRCHRELMEDVGRRRAIADGSQNKREGEGVCG